MVRGRFCDYFLTGCFSEGDEEDDLEGNGVTEHCLVSFVLIVPWYCCAIFMQCSCYDSYYDAIIVQSLYCFAILVLSNFLLVIFSLLQQLL